MFDDILDRLAERAPRKIGDEEARLNREVRKLVHKIKTKSSKGKSIKSLRGGLQSMGARGVLVKEGNIYSRRVIVKASYIQSANEKARERIRKHLNYVGRATQDDGKNSPELYSGDEQNVDVKNKLDDFESAPHMFNIIVSPEDGSKLDLKDFTREFIHTVEKDLRTKLDWVAGNHYDTNEPHVHILIRGEDDSGQKLLMSRDYISRGLRARASEVINNSLGLRDHDEVIASIELNVSSSKKCEIDDVVARNTVENKIDISKLGEDAVSDLPRTLIEKRLKFLESKELAHKLDEHRWYVKKSFQAELRNIHLTSSIITRLSDGLKVDRRSCEIVSAKNLTERIINGHVVERGYVEDLNTREYLLIKSKEKKLVYVELEKFSEKVPAQIGEFIRIDVTKPFSGPLSTDHTIEKFARSNAGIYDAIAHANHSERSVSLPPGVSAREYAQVHVNRLELLARKGLVKKLSDGKFLLPKNYLESIAAEAKRSSEGYQPHIKVVRLSPSRLKSPELNRGLSR